MIIKNKVTEKNSKPTVEIEQGVLDEACHQQELNSFGSGRLQNLKMMRLLQFVLPSVYVQPLDNRWQQCGHKHLYQET